MKEGREGIERGREGKRTKKEERWRGEMKEGREVEREK